MLGFYKSFDEEIKGMKGIAFFNPGLTIGISTILCLVDSSLLVNSEWHDKSFYHTAPQFLSTLFN